MSSVRLNAKFATALRLKGLKGKEGNDGTAKARGALRLEDGGRKIRGRKMRGWVIGLLGEIFQFYVLKTITLFLLSIILPLSVVKITVLANFASLRTLRLI